ncbi:MAG: copper resistance CopC family protein [Lentilitoribacter sp.]
MIKKFALTIAATLIISCNAMAHSPLKSTSPKNNAELNKIPDMLHFTFGKPARMVKVTMTHSTSDVSHEMKLDLPNKDLVEELHLTPDFMGNGNYLVEWRALSEDGHALKGEFSFTVNGG